MGSESTYWDYIPDNISKEHWSWLWTEGVRLGMFRNGHLMHGALEGCRKLAADGHKLIIITHRPACAVNDTLAWLSFQQLNLSGIHVQTNQEPKSWVKPHCDVYIDDKWENVVDLAKNTPAKLVALFNQPWNQQIGPEGWDLKTIKRVKDWPTFVREVETVH